jgi:hypothetical protein
MFLILIHVTWETEFYKFGMYEKKDSDKKVKYYSHIQDIQGPT